jgi:hypothetical protein
MAMTTLQTFVCGVAGSVAVEVVTLYQHYDSEPIKVPERYSKVGFWVVRLLLSAVAGALAVAYDIQQPLLAANIGAATPLIVKTLATKLQGPS